MLTTLKSSVSLAMVFSIAVHAFVLSIQVKPLDPHKAADIMQPLHVVLVNSKSNSRPVKADALAQANLDGGGNTEEDRQLQTSTPKGDDQTITPEQATRHVAHLEEESKRMLTRLKSSYNMTQPQPQKHIDTATSTADDLVQRSMEIAHLEAQINKQNDNYQKMPRRKFIGARTQEYRFAQYIEDWRVKVERVGNLNYPEQARREHLTGKLQLSVSIRADGSIENIEVSNPSPHRLLDAAAMRIVKLAGPFSPLPPNITKDVDILTITRTWNFTDKLESE